jgi:hypothetical protein
LICTIQVAGITLGEDYAGISGNYGGGFLFSKIRGITYAHLGRRRPMNDADRRRLTEFLGEPWWGLEGLVYVGGVYVEPKHNRSFLTPQDLHDVKDKLVEKGIVNDFYGFSFEVFKGEYNQRHYNEEVDGLGIFLTWLFRPVNEGGAHFCQLAADFLREQQPITILDEGVEPQMKRPNFEDTP